MIDAEGRQDVNSERLLKASGRGAGVKNAGSAFGRQHNRNPSFQTLNPEPERGPINLYEGVKSSSARISQSSMCLITFVFSLPLSWKRSCAFTRK